MATFRELHGEPELVDDDSPAIYHGKELSDEDAEQIADNLRAKAREQNLIPGGKSLSGGRKHSPVVQFRVPEDLQQRLDERARIDHESTSKVARKALEAYLNTRSRAG